MNCVSYIRSILVVNQSILPKRYVHITACLNKTQAGRYRPIPNKPQYLTYEMANPPHFIAHRKSWNSWNTSNIKDGKRPAETAVEDLFMRNFITGTFPGCVVTEIIIKRQHNMIRIAFIVRRIIVPSKLYFLIGYTEQLLSYWLHCPVKIEIVTVQTTMDVIYKVI